MGVLVYSGIPDTHIDKRREIDDAVLEGTIILPFLLRQIKMINFFSAAVEEKMAVGNHYHPTESDRQEFFTFLGSLSEEEKKNPPPAVLFRYRKAGAGEFIEKTLKVGDSCLVPTGWTHAFLPLIPNVFMIGLSNKPFDSADDVVDKLFP